MFWLITKIVYLPKFITNESKYLIYQFINAFKKNWLQKLRWIEEKMSVFVGRTGARGRIPWARSPSPPRRSPSPSSNPNLKELPPTWYSCQIILHITIWLYTARNFTKFPPHFGKIRRYTGGGVFLSLAFSRFFPFYFILQFFPKVKPITME